MLIDTTSGSAYFTLFYSLAFLFAFLMLLWEGYQRKIPTVSWVLLLIFSRISFIVGTKIFTYDRVDWQTMVQQETLIPTTEKLLFGGIILGIIAIMIGKYILRIKQNILDAFAVIVPLSFGIQKIGCFLNGCCYGKPTALPWGVQYPVNTVAHFNHYQSGQTGINELLSLPIHPVQIYEMTGAFLVAFIVFKSRKLWKANGSLLLFSILLFCLVRFLTEFFRDIKAHTIGGEMFGIFNQIQWALIVAVFILSLILLYREKRQVLTIQNLLPSPSTGIPYYLLIFGFEALMILALRNWFSYSELIVILVTFLISSVIFFFWILKQIASSKSKIFYSALLLLPLLITSQTIQQTKSDSTSIIKTRKISFGLISGAFENSFAKPSGTTEGGCTTYENQYFKQKYLLGGGSYSIKNEYPESHYSTNLGINLFLGQNSETVLSTNVETKTLLYGVNPFIKFDAKWIGFGCGIHWGNILYPQGQIKSETDLTTTMTKKIFTRNFICVLVQGGLFLLITIWRINSLPLSLPFISNWGLDQGLVQKVSLCCVPVV